MDSKTDKGKPLTKEETKALLCFIQASKVINNKTTNATTNKLKNEEWHRIADQFNATVITTCRRTPQQLRLKWENLKKNSRKRSTAIRMNNIKTGGGGPDYIPPDDILDRVSSLLGSTVEGFVVEFGGDAEPQHFQNGGDADVHNGSDNGQLASSTLSVDNVLSVDNLLSTDKAEVIGEAMVVDHCLTTITPTRPKLMFSTPRASGFKCKKRTQQNDGRAGRNKAIEEYYILKKKYLEVKFNNIILEKEKLELEIKELKKKESN